MSRLANSPVISMTCRAPGVNTSIPPPNELLPLIGEQEIVVEPRRLARSNALRCLLEPEQPRFQDVLGGCERYGAGSWPDAGLDRDPRPRRLGRGAREARRRKTGRSVHPTGGDGVSSADPRLRD